MCFPSFTGHPSRVFVLDTSVLWIVFDMTVLAVRGFTVLWHILLIISLRCLPACHELEICLGVLESRVGRLAGSRVVSRIYSPC
jgi:hypothetical protein